MLRWPWNLAVHSASPGGPIHDTQAKATTSSTSIGKPFSVPAVLPCRYLSGFHMRTISQLLGCWTERIGRGMQFDRWKKIPVSATVSQVTGDGS